MVQARSRGQGPGRELVLVSTFGPQNWEHAVNTAHPALHWSGGIHPRPADACLYARVVLAAIKAGLTGGEQPTCLPHLTTYPDAMSTKRE
jgi:hypothetical protein